MNGTGRFWAGIVAVNATAALLATAAFDSVTWHTPWGDILSSAATSFLFSMCCSSLCIIALPRLAPMVLRRVPFPLNWLAIVVALVIFASIGSLTSVLILAAGGVVPVRAVFSVWFGTPLKVSVIATLLFGIFGTVVERLRARLDAATLALRTKQRDEAEARRLAAEAQLASIESRVQPHFLFNTLNSIAALVHDDPAGAERMTGQLASLMRSSLDSTARPLVPLDEELRVVQAYLDIERVRFGDRLRYTIVVDDDVRDTRVPRLAIQTIVENSVKYAVSPRREGASIAVRAAANNGHVEICIEDDGPGFDAATPLAGHGLALVRERLAMTLGGASALRVDSRPSRTTVSLSVPPSTEQRVPSTAQRVPSTE